jgi:hypothetical protein
MVSNYKRGKVKSIIAKEGIGEVVINGTRHEFALRRTAGVPTSPPKQGDTIFCLIPQSGPIGIWRTAAEQKAVRQDATEVAMNDLNRAIRSSPPVFSHFRRDPWDE